MASFESYFFQKRLAPKYHPKIAVAVEQMKTIATFKTTE
jgi:hypothetical protein